MRLGACWCVLRIGPGLGHAGIAFCRSEVSRFGTTHASGLNDLSFLRLGCEPWEGGSEAEAEAADSRSPTHAGPGGRALRLIVAGATPSRTLVGDI